jgi:hypothetical protein
MRPYTLDVRTRQRMAADFLTPGHTVRGEPQEYSSRTKVLIWGALAIAAWLLTIGAFRLFLYALDLLGQLVGAW